MKMRREITIFFLALVLVVAGYTFNWAAQTVLRIYDYKSGEVYVEVPAKGGDKLFFGWIHSWEKIPWNEYYTIMPDNTIVWIRFRFLPSEQVFRKTKARFAA
jgi:hypothetical protein